MANHTEPRPREWATLRTKSGWPAIAVDTTRFEPPQFHRPIAETIEARRTRRALDALSDAQTLGLIDRLCHAHLRSDGSEGVRMRKSAISAGALHPIDVIVIGDAERAPLLYNDSSRVFEILAVHNKAALAEAVANLRAMAPDARGHLVVLAGHLARVASAYENPESLLWRDAGAVDQLLAMGAFAAGGAYLPLGALPQAIVRSIRGNDEEVLGVGCGLIGRPS